MPFFATPLLLESVTLNLKAYTDCILLPADARFMACDASLVASARFSRLTVVDE